MISSVSYNRFATSQTDCSRRQSLVSTGDPNQKTQQDSALKTDNPQAKDHNKTGRLSENDLKVLSELKQRDSEVRAHEAAHLAAAGGIATGGAHFSYQQGPDGVRYAVSGEVNIDTSPISGDPAATQRKADVIRRAALAPAQPSGPDMQVAARATAMAAQAQTELLQKKLDTQHGDKSQLGTQVDLSA